LEASSGHHVAIAKHRSWGAIGDYRAVSERDSPVSVGLSKLHIVGYTHYKSVSGDKALDCSANSSDAGSILSLGRFVQDHNRRIHR
jgi:hypothetical protein